MVFKRLKTKLRGKKQGLTSDSPDESALSTLALSATTVLAASSQPDSSDTALTTQSLPERLWNQAYDDLKEEESGLVDTYEKLLSHELEGDPSSTDLKSQKNEIEQENPEMRRDQMSRLVASGLKKIEKEIKIKENIEEITQPLSAAKGIIGTVVMANPEASLAWAGVCCALQMLANPITETRANREGIAYVVSRMKWYWQLSELLLDKNRDDQKSAGLKDELEKHVVDLYKTLLLYQMKSVYSYYRSRHVVFWRDVIKLDDWDGTLKAVYSAEKIVREDSTAYNTESIKTYLDSLAKTAKSLEEELLPGFRQAIQEQTAAQREMRQEEKSEKQERKSEKCLVDLRATDPRLDKKRIEHAKGGLFPDSSNWIIGHEDFRRWRDDDEARLLWIKGDPGKGKTMLLIAIVNELENQLKRQEPPATLSYFFCQATNKALNNATAVLRGLVYLLGDQNLSLVSHLRTSYDTAGSKLFEDANAFFALSGILEDMLRDSSLSRVYIVIDALDECVADLEKLLDFICRNTSDSPCVKWIVSSRNHVQKRLDNPGMTLSLELSENAKQVAGAVNAYIDFKISKVTSLQDNGKLRDQVLTIMRQKATGTFLWVALVIQEIQKAEGWEILELVEEVPTGLEELYDRMVNHIQKLNRKKPHFCRLVLSTVTLAYQPLHLAELGVLSGLPDTIRANIDHVREIVALCGSFLTIQDEHVYLIHQSVKDYLSGKASCTIFPSGPTEVHRAVGSQSLQAMSTLRRDIYDLHQLGILIDEIKVPDPDPLAAIRYSCVYWVGHFCDGYNGSCPEVDAVCQFFREKSLYWLEAIGLTKHIGDVILSMTRLESLLKQSSDGQLLDLVQDSRRFLLHNRWVIENAPLQVYASALLFSPVNSLMRKLFEKEVEWIATKPIVTNVWSSCLQMLESHTNAVCSVTFSHDSKLLASGSLDNTIKIWDATGSLQQTLEGHTYFVESIAFSHDSKLLASGSSDNTIKIWDAATGSFQLQQTLEGHTDHVRSVGFSHDSKLLASGSEDRTIKIWDTVTGSLQHTLELDTIVYTISFEATGLYLDTNIGRIDLAAKTKRIQSLPPTPHPDQAQETQYYGYDISSDKSWVTWNNHNVLWLPIDYRPLDHAISSFASPSTLSTVIRIGIGSYSGRVVVIGLPASGPYENPIL